jgi:hypothetical protein
VYITFLRAQEDWKEEWDQQAQEDRKGQQVHGEPWVCLDHQELMYATSSYKFTVHVEIFTAWTELLPSPATLNCISEKFMDKKFSPN